MRVRPVSGTVVPGIMVGDPSTRVTTPEAITIRLPRNPGPILCVTVTSQDGRYYARAPFKLLPTVHGDITLDGPPRYKNNLRRYPAGELAILAELVPSCDSPSRRPVPARWGGTAGDTDVFVYVNSRYHTEALWRGTDGKSQRTTCPETDNGLYVAYNRVCRIPRAGLADSTSLLVRSRRDGSYFNTTIPLLHPR